MPQLKERTNVRKHAKKEHEVLGLTGQEVIDLYAQMMLVRTLDERVWALNRQGKVPIAASSQGHEAAQMGTFKAAQNDGRYFLFPYYRDLALKMAAGLSPILVMRSFMGREGDPFSGGRQFPLQGASLEHRIIQISNVVAAGLTQAVGYALGCRLLGEDTVVLAYFGDGGASMGECHEAMNFASVHKLPVIFICENNKYAISVPLRKQMAIQNVADRASSYGFPGHVIDGMDILKVYAATTQAIKHARTQGPILLEMKVDRFMAHTTDDDDRRYREKGELEEARKRDPLLVLHSYLMDAGLLTEEQDQSIRAQARQEVDEATDIAEATPYPDPSTFYDHLYADRGR